VPGARFLRVTPAGQLLVSLSGSDRVELLQRDADGDGRSDGKRVLIEDLNRPHGLDFHAGWLYVAETDAIGRIRFESATGVTQGSYERIVTGIPSGGHWTRTARFGPDGLLYVSIGSSCNACEEDDPRRAAIVRYRPDGSGEEIFATGLRNAVGFDWRPETGALFANDNGRDLLGDDFPPCELNLVEEGGFYGWPLVNGDGIPDPDFETTDPERVAVAISPVHGYPAHNAPLGLHFVRTSAVPVDYRGAALSALHGSWNRTQKDGYKVVSLHWLPDGSIEQRDFVSGFEVDDNVIGRPVDVTEGPDGAFYVSDDYSGVIYRVAYVGPDVASRGVGQ
jgi:glucose/arabinose dehydrogenase